MWGVVCSARRARRAHKTVMRWKNASSRERSNWLGGGVGSRTRVKAFGKEEKELVEPGRSARDYVPGGNDRGMFRVRSRQRQERERERKGEERERERESTGTRNTTTEREGER